MSKEFDCLAEEHQRFIERMQVGLEKLQAAAESGRLKDLGTAYERLGRLRQRCWRASGAFEVNSCRTPTRRACAGRMRWRRCWSRTSRRCA